MNAVVWADYLINFEYIKEVLCVNKEKPKLNCNGKCYLMGQLKQSEPKEEENQIPKLEITKTEYIDLSKLTDSTKGTSTNVYDKQAYYYKLGVYSQQHQEVFHPPKN